MKKKYALKKRLQDIFKKNYLIIILLFIFFIIKVSYLSKFHNIIWDEAVYIGMGKYLYSLGKVGFWEIIRPPGLPLLLGFFWKIGLNHIFFAELLSIIFSMGNIFLVYLIGKDMINRRFGFIASFILSITSVFFLYTNYILTGIPSTFFVLLGVYFYLKKKNIFLAGIFCGISSLFRFPQALSLICFIILFFFHYLKDKDIAEFIKKSAKFIVAFLLVHIPFFIFNYNIYHKETSKIYHALFRPWILAFWHQNNPAESIITTGFFSGLYNIFYYIIQILKENTLFIFLFFGLFFFFRKKLHKKENFLLIFAMLIVYFAYFSFISNKQTRFLIAFLPYASLIAAYGFYNSFLKTKKDRVRILIVVFVIISLIGVISRDLVYYEWRIDNEPPIVQDYYKYFQGKQVFGPILTTDPVPVAYVDAEFIPFYFSVDMAYDIYDSNKDKSFATIFSPESFYCLADDKGCKVKLKELLLMIEQENELEFTDIYGERAYYIYLNKDFK